jgi:hypothetical protein
MTGISSLNKNWKEYQEMDNRAPMPNFFIVGAARSGTTALANYIGQHPDIYVSPVKEPCYFLPDYGVDNYGEYLTFFSKAGSAMAIGEASTGYLFDLHAARGILGRFPDAKIIIILRNPVDMALSLWQFMTVNGSESKSFKNAISPEERRYRKTDQFKKECASWSWWANYIYIERALYFNQVKMYIDAFGRDQVRIYIFENFIRSPVKTCQDLFNFLKVDSSFVPKCRILNEGGELRFLIIKKLIDRFYPSLRPLLPIGIRTKLAALVQSIITNKKKKSSIHPDTRKALEDMVRNDIAMLESELGYQIDEWRH